MSGEADLRQRVIAATLEMSRSGLSPQKSGNVSARIGEGMLITPTGVDYAAMRPEDIVYVGLDGARRSGELAPSSEWHFHLAVYRAKPEAGGIVHTHSDYATSLACMERKIPAFHYMVAVAGGSDIPCASYATFGTEALADAVVAALADRRACLMSHHGQLACGETVEKALTLAKEVETLAGQYWRCLQIGEPGLLSAEEMARVLEKFGSYGQQPAVQKRAGRPAGRKASAAR